MKTIVKHEENNINPKELMNIMINSNYYNYLIKAREDMISYNIDSFKYNDNDINMQITFEILIKIPSFARVFFNKSKKVFKITEHSSYNFKDNTAKIIVKSKENIANKCDFNYTYKLTEIEKNKTSKKIVFNYSCSTPIIGKMIEKYIAKKTKDQRKADSATLS